MGVKDVPRVWRERRDAAVPEASADAPPHTQWERRVPGRLDAPGTLLYTTLVARVHRWIDVTRPRRRGEQLGEGPRLIDDSQNRRIGRVFMLLFHSILFSRRYFYPTTYRPKHDSLHPYARDGAVGGQDYARRGLRSLFLFFGVLGDFPGQPALRVQ